MATGALLCDAMMSQFAGVGTTIGMNTIKARRLTLSLTSNPGLHVGECVPHYFCPRSVMLYMFHLKNHPELTYRGGQESIIHLVADLHQTVQWARNHNLRWAFTLSNAGSRYFEDRADLAQLNEINWAAVESTYWAQSREEKHGGRNRRSF